MRQSTDRGDSLIEIVIAVVIIGITVSALISSLGAAGTSAQFQRTSVETDTVMRNYAEATKAAARDCAAGRSFAPAFDPPDGYAIAAEPSEPSEPGDVSCPAAGTSRTVTLSVTGPTGVQQQMRIVIRTP